jgi:hypothetical protein
MTHCREKDQFQRQDEAVEQPRLDRRRGKAGYPRGRLAAARVEVRLKGHGAGGSSQLTTAMNKDRMGTVSQLAGAEE